MPEKLLLTYDQAAALVEMSPSWIKKQVREGRLPVAKLGTAARIPVEALTKLVEERTHTVGGTVDTPDVPGPSSVNSPSGQVVEKILEVRS